MSRCMLFPPPGYLWNGVGGQALIQLIKLNADRERKKQKRRRKEKRKRRENLETVEQRRKDLDNTSLLTEMVKPAQPMEFHFQHDSSENLQIIERRKAIELHPNNGQHADHGYGAKTFCACWIFSFHHSDIDVGLLPCLSELKKCMHQVLLSKQIDIDLQQVLGSRPFCNFHSPNGKLDLISEGGSLLIESQFTELILNWVPTPWTLRTPSLGISSGSMIEGHLGMTQIRKLVLLTMIIFAIHIQHYFKYRCELVTCAIFLVGLVCCCWSFM